MFGFLNIYKPKGKTSHDIVAVLRRITKIKQIGHTGTLDPFAEGVLPICIGKATRLIEYLDDDKAYLGTIQLGQATTTFDTEGEIVKSSTKKVSLEEINNILPKFKGDIEQIPPIYSAIKVKGKKLYEYARSGIDVEIEPRKVNISVLEIIDFNYEKQTLEILVECSKGTYIRSIANDIGNALGSYGHLIKLVRNKAGMFLLENTINIDSLENVNDVKAKLLQPLDYLKFPRYELNNDEKNKVSHGMPILIEQKDGLISLTFQNEIIAIASITDNKAKVLKVFI